MTARIWMALLIVYVVWGSTYLAIRIAIETLPMFFMAGVRFLVAGGVLFAKFLNLFTKEKINPMVGAAGISAFPMSARVIHQEAQKADPANFLLNHAVSANVAGQIGSIIAGGLILALVK